MNASMSVPFCLVRRLHYGTVCIVVTKSKQTGETTNWDREKLTAIRTGNKQQALYM